MRAKEEYRLTAKLFRGSCGAYLCGESGASHTGTTHRYYKCVFVKNKLPQEVCQEGEDETLFVNSENIEVIGNRPYYFFENGAMIKQSEE